MRAVVFNGELQYLSDRKEPEPGPGEELVQVCACGICNTDLEIIKGYSGFNGILGHEFVGRVVSDGLLVGKRVVGEINITCGQCEYCLKGRGNHCPARTVLGIVNKDGAMADYLTLPLANLHVLPDCITDEEAIFVEPLAAALQAVEQAKPERDTEVLVMGDGKLGILCAMAFSLVCRNVTLSGRHSQKLEIARRAGIQTVHQDGLDHRTFDLVVEATGAEGGLAEALGNVRPQGTVILKTTIAGESSLHLFPVVVNEITIIGSRCGPFARAIEAMAAGKIEVSTLVSASYPAELALQAFQHAVQKGTMKVLLTFL